MTSKPVFPYESFRPGQLELARRVEEAVKAGKALLVEAPTGFGKTAAVVYGLLRAGADRVLYVVRTRNELQPVIRELHRFGVDYVFLYSAKKMCPLVRRDIDVEDFWENCRLLRLQGLCNYYASLEEISPEAIRFALKEAGEDIYYAPRLLARSGVCPFYSLKKLLDRSNFIAATYPYLFNPNIFASVFEPLTYSDFVVVVDEAHSLLSLESIGEQKTSLEAIRAGLKELEKYYGRDSQAYKSLEKLTEYISALHPSTRLRRIDKRILVDILGDPSEWREIATDVRIKKAEEAIEKTGEPSATIKVYLQKLAEFYEHAYRSGVRIYYLKQRDHVIVKALPVDPCSILKEPLGEPIAVILQSGTMPPLEYAKRAFCLQERSIESYTAEPQPNTSRTDSNANFFAIVASYLTSKYTSRGEHIYKLYAETITRIYQAIDKTLLVVYPSYEFMESIIKLVEIEDIIVEDRATSITSVQKEVSSKKHIVVNAVAGGKLVEGVEYLDENKESLLEAVLVAGVPYPQPDDYIEDYFEAVSESRKAELVEALTILASIKTRQALGRAIRSEKDRALYVLGDRRFLSKRLRELVRLPYHRVARSLEELESFLSEWKKVVGRE